MIESYPTSVLIDPDGVIVSMDSGTQGLKDVEKVIEKYSKMTTITEMEHTTLHSSVQSA